jgi:hypothetical protein
MQELTSYSCDLHSTPETSEPKARWGLRNQTYKSLVSCNIYKLHTKETKLRPQIFTAAKGKFVVSGYDSGLSLRGF